MVLGVKLREPTRGFPGWTGSMEPLAPVPGAENHGGSAGCSRVTDTHLQNSQDVAFLGPLGWVDWDRGHNEKQCRHHTYV